MRRKISINKNNKLNRPGCTSSNLPLAHKWRGPVLAIYPSPPRWGGQCCVSKLRTVSECIIFQFIYSRFLSVFFLGGVSTCPMVSWFFGLLSGFGSCYGRAAVLTGAIVLGGGEGDHGGRSRTLYGRDTIADLVKSFLACEASQPAIN